MKTVKICTRTFLTLLFIGTTLFCSGQPAKNFPGWLEDPMFIYHPLSKAMLLLGGTTLIYDSVKADVWKWDGNQWSKIESEGPGTRVFFKGDLNVNTGLLQFFAGAGLGRTISGMDDFWAFNGKTWKRMETNNIGTHDHHKMVYADHLNAYVLYGGNTDHHFDTTTWLLRDGQFTKLNIKGPGPKYQSGMVYDKHRKRVVLYGGGEKPDEHWEFDGNKWEKIITEVSPGIKLYHMLVYDENLKAVILHAGQINHRPLDPINLQTPTTWLWNGKTWEKIAEEKIFPISMGYYPPRKSVIAYGFNSGDWTTTRNIELWELKDMKWKKLEDYGTWNTAEYLTIQSRQNPDDLMTQSAYASHLRSNKKFPEAEVEYKKLIVTKIPQKVNIMYGLLDVLKNQNKFVEAHEYLLNYPVPGEMRMMSIMHYNLACDFALAKDTERAFTHLNKSIDFGFDDKKHYENDPDLNTLRSDDRWKSLAERLK